MAAAPSMDDLDTLHGVARALVRVEERFAAFLRRDEERQKERERRERRRFAALALLVTFADVLLAGVAIWRA